MPTDAPNTAAVCPENNRNKQDQRSCWYFSLQSHNTGRGRKIISQELNSSHQLEIEIPKILQTQPPIKRNSIRDDYMKKKKNTKKQGESRKNTGSKDISTGQWCDRRAACGHRGLQEKTDEAFLSRKQETTRLSYARTWHV